MDYCSPSEGTVFFSGRIKFRHQGKLEQFNANTFQKKEGSRRSLFLGEEMPLPATLPATCFELSDWKVATVQFNYHIAVDKMYYSVPYQYIKNKVDVRITETTIEIFMNHNHRLPQTPLWTSGAVLHSVRTYATRPPEISFEDRFGMLVDVEYTSRKNNRLKLIIRNAELEQSDACIAGIDYRSGRKLNKELINRLATCEYIAEYRNIFITGATGSGKTYTACAFGMEACKQYYTVKYVRLPDLPLGLEAARNDGKFTKVLSKYIKPLLLIIDEWLLLKLNESESKNLFELIHKRRKKSSTIFCS